MPEPVWEWHVVSQDELNRHIDQCEKFGNCKGRWKRLRKGGALTYTNLFKTYSTFPLQEARRVEHPDGGSLFRHERNQIRRDHLFVDVPEPVEMKNNKKRRKTTLTGP